MAMILKIAFWTSVCYIFYVCCGYALIVYFTTFFASRKVKKTYAHPFVSVIIAAFNEENNIKSRLENLFLQDYPKDRMEIVVVSDGSTDDTDNIVTSYGRAVVFCSIKAHQGKAAALNHGVSAAKGDILVFTDARQAFKDDAIKELVANFSDPVVGAVSGALCYADGANGNMASSIAMYWNHEKWLRKNEGLIDSTIGVTGAIYAVRKSLYEPLPVGLILDDVMVPMRVILKGHRVAFDYKAVAFEHIGMEENLEFKRKVRTLAGNLQILRLMPQILSPRKNRLFINYVSHKVMRLLNPYFLLFVFVLNAFMLKGWYSAFFLAQALFYLSAFLGFLCRKNKKLLTFLSFPYSFTMLNIAAVFGALYYIRGKDNIWSK